MMIFINTRPKNRAKELTEFLQNRHIQVIDLPLLELIEKPLDTFEKQALTDIYQTNSVILVSEEAVNYGLSALADHFDLTNIAQSPIIWVAVGEKTANYFSHAWQNLSDTPAPIVLFPKDKQQQNNEGLLALAEIQGLNTGDNVQIWRGVGGRELLANQLLAKGVDVQLINFYQRIFPKASEQIFAQFILQLHPANCPTVLITSMTAWQYWEKLCEKYAVNFTDWNYVVLQNRLFIHLSQAIPTHNLKQIDSLDPTTVWLACDF